jgi:hypothetical protein
MTAGAEGVKFCPLGDRLLVNAARPGQRPQALSTVLSCSTNRLCRAGAAL